MHDQYVIYIIDDDSAVRGAISTLVESVGLSAIEHESAESFIDALDINTPSVIVVDVRLSGMGGMELQEWLIENRICIPIIVISGHGDIPMAVSMIKRGAVDFLEKPFRNQTLLDGIRKAIKIDKQLRVSLIEVLTLETSYNELTNREREVCTYIQQAMPSKKIASKMNVSYRTIEGYRSQILKKMNSSTSQELMIDLVKIKKEIQVK